jgi:Tol biopolymer transport system component
MITGRKAFSGDNAASVISAVMTAEPQPIGELQPNVSPGLERVIQFCLKKDPEERWQSARDVRNAIDLADVPTQSAAPARVSASRSKTNWWIPAAFTAGLAIAALGFKLAAPKPVEQPSFRPLTYSGRADLPSLSPDGKQITFTWSGEKDQGFAQYVQLVAGGNPLRLDAAKSQGKVAWSPDGSRLAFAQNDGLYVMPALGGASRRIASLPSGWRGADVAWAPSGEFFVMSTDRSSLMVAPAQGGNLRELTHPKVADDHSPAISPASDAIAFVRHTSSYNSQLFILAVGRDGSAAGEPRQLTSGVWDIGGVDWTSDGKEVVFEGTPGSNNPTLWRIPRAGGNPQRILVPNLVAGEPSVGLHSGHLAYVSSQEETGVFKLALGNKASGEAESIVNAIGYHSDLAVSKDGTRIAFADNRTGTKEIWVANADGSQQTQLTSFNGPAVGSPQWSRDGKWIVFDGYASGSSDIYLIASDGGNPTQLTHDKTNEVRPSWSHDGKWIFILPPTGKATNGRSGRCHPGAANR